MVIIIKRLFIGKKHKAEAKLKYKQKDLEMVILQLREKRQEKRIFT